MKRIFNKVIGKFFFISRKVSNRIIEKICIKANQSNFFFKHEGFCPCCEQETIFLANDSWLRDSFLCTKCGCKPRERALMVTIEKYYPEWPQLSIHECSPIKRGASIKLGKYGQNYLASQYYPKHPLGEMVDGFRNEDLENQTFPDESFDLVITQDVMEHIYNPAKAFAEIARTLRPGGAHIFTVPIINKHKKTEVWATKGNDGEPVFLHKPEWHGNPVDSKGSPVTMHWGFDIVDFIKETSGLESTIEYIDDLHHGIRAEYIEVVVSRKLDREEANL